MSIKITKNKRIRDRHLLNLKLAFKKEMLSRLAQPFLTIMPLSASNKRALSQFGRQFE